MLMTHMSLYLGIWITELPISHLSAWHLVIINGVYTAFQRQFGITCGLLMCLFLKPFNADCEFIGMLYFQ